MFLFFLLSVIILSCENSVRSDPTFSRRKAPIISLEKVQTTSSSISISTLASWTNGCGEFSHYLIDSKENDISITLFGKETSIGACPTAIIFFEAPIEIFVDEPGEYNLHFWQSDSTSLDTTIVL